MTRDRKLIIGTAGHIDHGKTVLVKALTGKDTDRLAEEKERGISIDLGFAPFELPDGSVAGIVDVPGHENFVRNMLAGATGVDLALLVVAADDGVMPQTREHLAILDLLGVPMGIVAVTKTDLVDDELVPLVEEEIRELVAGTLLEQSEVMAVSAVTGDGMETLRNKIAEAASQVRLKDDKLPARLPIDRVFSLKGIGTVVTGTLWAGTIHIDDNLQLLPGGDQARARSLQAHDEPRDRVFAGERVAVNLAGIPKRQLSRGDVLCEPGCFKPTYMIDCSISLLEGSPRTLKRGTRIRFHHGTRETMGRVYPFEAETISPAEKKPAQIRLEAQVVCSPGDRFVIRSYSPITTIGGGEVIDAHPSKHKLHDALASEEFRLLESGSLGERISVFLEREKEPVSIGELVLDSGVPPDSVREGLDLLVEKEKALILGEADREFFLSMGALRDISQTARLFLEVNHRENPLAEGVAKETFKNQILGAWENRRSETMLAELEKEGVIELSGELIRLPGAGAAVSDEQVEAMKDIVVKLSERPFSPPGVSELVDEIGLGKKEVVGLLSIAEKDGLLVRVSPDLFFTARAVEQAVETLQSSIPEGGITVSEFRQRLGTSRKYALPLLEYFDRNKITVRVGDERRLR